MLQPPLVRFCSISLKVSRNARFFCVSGFDSIEIMPPMPPRLSHPRRLLAGLGQRKPGVVGQLAHRLVADRGDHLLEKGEQPLDHVVGQRIAHALQQPHRVEQRVERAGAVHLSHPVDQLVHGFGGLRLVEAIYELEGGRAGQSQTLDHGVGQRLAHAEAQPLHLVHRRVGKCSVVHGGLPQSRPRADSQ